MTTTVKRGRPRKYDTTAMITQLKAVAAELGTSPSIAAFNTSATATIKAQNLVNRFGGWNAALAAAELPSRRRGRPKAFRAASVAEAAVHVLRTERKAMTPKEIAEAISTKKVFALSGKAPRNTVGRALNRTCKAGKVALVRQPGGKWAVAA